jgi:hypothetical protein
MHVIRLSKLWNLVKTVQALTAQMQLRQEKHAKVTFHASEWRAFYVTSVSVFRLTRTAVHVLCTSTTRTGCKLTLAHLW